MELQGLLDEFRNQVSDTAQPYLWSDEEVLRYIIDAQDQFCRKTGGIADVTVAAADVGNPVTRLQDLAVTANTVYTAHSPYILRIMSGRLLTDERDIEFVLESDLQNLYQEDYGSNIEYSLDDTEVGEVKYGILGIRDKYVRWLKVPEETDTCRIRFYRLPFPRISDWDTVGLEIDEFHHIHLIKWMKHLAYSKQDAEARNDKLAAENKAMFEEYTRESKNELDRRRYRPRIVHYGGI